LTREQNLDPRTLRGSYAGAMGMPQFIASSYRGYAVDFDGDGQANLFDSIPDIFASVANYFVKHGWRANEAVAGVISGLIWRKTGCTQKLNLIRILLWRW